MGLNRLNASAVLATIVTSDAIRNEFLRSAGTRNIRYLGYVGLCKTALVILLVPNTVIKITDMCIYLILQRVF